MFNSLGALAAQAAVAIPAKDEAAHIVPCLRALAAQSVAPGFVVLCINNTTDGTAAAARSVPLPSQTTLVILERALPPELAYAGAARRIAMDEASRLAGTEGVVLTTDADGAADANWLEANLRLLQSGLDVVAGWVDLDQASWHAIPRRLHDDDARECAYDALCDEMAARLDPDPWDPMPRHTQNSGASIALWSRLYRQCGGLPLVRQGEDRALIETLRRMDAKIRHAPEVHVTVSGRIEGRAAGGMADTIRRRLASPDPYLDDRLEPAEACARRHRLRAMLRAARKDQALLEAVSAELRLDRNWLLPMLRAVPFGAVWAAVEARSPVLQRSRVSVAALPAEMRAAQGLVDGLRAAPETAQPGAAARHAAPVAPVASARRRAAEAAGALLHAALDVASLDSAPAPLGVAG